MATASSASGEVVEAEVRIGWDGMQRLGAIDVHFVGGMLRPERRAHVPLGAGTSGTHGVNVVITINHSNETAPSGYVARLVRLRIIWGMG